MRASVRSRRRFSRSHDEPARRYQHPRQAGLVEPNPLTGPRGTTTVFVRPSATAPAIVPPPPPAIQPTTILVRPTTANALPVPPPVATQPIPPVASNTAPIAGQPSSAVVRPSQPASQTSSVAGLTPTPTPGSGANGGGVNGNSRPSASVVTSPLPTDSNSAIPNASGGLGSSGGLSTGAIVGIVLAILIILVAAVVFFLRRKAIFARKQKRATWLSKGGIMGPQPIPGYDGLPGATEKVPPPVPAGFGMASQRNTYVSGAATEQAAFAYATNDFVQTSPYGGVAPPASSYNNPSSAPATAIAVQSPQGMSNAGLTSVVCTFIPTLPDELNLSLGESVRVLAEYDDGWALCMDSRGDQGMVPLECLDRSVAGSAQPPPQAFQQPSGGQFDARDYRRASSLTVSSVGTVPQALRPNRLN